MPNNGKKPKKQDESLAAAIIRMRQSGTRPTGTVIGGHKVTEKDQTASEVTKNGVTKKFK